MEEPLFLPLKLRRESTTVYCNWCKSSVTDICKDTGLNLKKCRHGEAHVFKGVFYDTNGNKITRVLNTRDPHEAILEASRLKKEIKANILNKEERNIKTEKEDSPKSLIHCFAAYISHLNNEGVPEHLQRIRSTAHIKDVQHTFEIFVECWLEEGVNCGEISIDDLNDHLIGLLYKSIQSKELSDRTTNKYFSYATSFLKWWNEEHYPIRNWFSRIPRATLVHNPQGNTGEELMMTLAEITPENGIEMYPGTKKPKRNYYWTYSKSGIQFSALTGLRREELATVRWKDIECDSNGDPLIITVQDLKSNRIRKRKGDIKYKYVSVSRSLHKLLVELGFDQMKGKEDFVIAPEVIQNRMKVLPNNLSRSFSHFYAKTGMERNLTLKALRKTYLTRLKMYWSSIRHLSGHSDERVLDEFYLDRKQMAIAMRDFEVYPELETDRSQELNTIRNKSIDNQIKQLEK